MGKRPRHKPKRGYKDCLKNSLYKSYIVLDNWKTIIEDRNPWRAGIADGIVIFHEALEKYAKLKRGDRQISLNWHEVPT